MSVRPIVTALLLVFPCVAGAQQQPTPVDPRYRDPGTATLYSVALPGGGQLYAGETRRGLLLLGGSSVAILAGSALSSQASCTYDPGSPFGLACKEANYTPLTVGMLVSLGIWGYGVFDARASAERQNSRRSRSSRGGVTVDPVLVLDPRMPTIGAQIAF